MIGVLSTQLLKYIPHGRNVVKTCAMKVDKRNHFTEHNPQSPYMPTPFSAKMIMHTVSSCHIEITGIGLGSICEKSKEKVPSVQEGYL